MTTAADLFVEVNHGPFVVDNNLFLSGANLLDVSQGGAYAHNLFAGTMVSAPEPNRETPYHPPHTTIVAGLTNIKGGDSRFFNNIFVGRGESKEPSPYGLAVYDKREFPLYTGGNVYYNGAQPYKLETNPTVVSDHDPKLSLDRDNNELVLSLALGPNSKRPLKAR